MDIVDAVVCFCYSCFCFVVAIGVVLYFLDIVIANNFRRFAVGAKECRYEIMV